MRTMPHYHPFALLCLLFLCVTQRVQAQEGFFIGVGYNQSYASLDSLNFILDRYNEARPGLTKTLPSIHTPAGVAVRIGHAGEKWVTELGFTGRWQRAKGETVYPTYTEAQYVRYGAATVDIGTARRLGELFQLGLSIDLGAVNAGSRMGVQPRVGTQPYSKIVTGLTLGSTLHFQASLPLNDFLTLDIRPYYQHNWVNNDFSRLHQTINPQTFQPDPDMIFVNSSNAGLKVMLTVHLR
jgi:hypothetical protein